MTKTGGDNRKLILIFFGVLIVAAYFVGLGALPLIGPDEPRYAQVAREMFERNDLVTTTLGGFNWFEKPALLYWLMILADKLFGINEFAARVGSALFGLLTILTLYLLAKSLTANDPKKTTHGKTANIKQLAINDFPVWTLLVSASSIGILVFSHAATFDIILTFPIAAALACFFAFDKTNCDLQKTNYQLLIINYALLAGFYFFTGVALLAKGLIGAVLPVGIVFCYLAAIRKLPSKTFLFSLMWGACLTCAVAATWYLPVYLRHGWEFVDEFFIQHHFARYASNKYQHPEPFWFFWMILPGLTLPWTPFLIASIWEAVRVSSFKFQVSNPTEQSFRNLRVFAFCWLLVPLVFFSFSGSKLPGYVLPALPAALILASEQVWRFAANNQRRIVGLSGLAGATLVFGAFAPFFFQHYAQQDSAKFVESSAPFATEKVLSLHDVSHSLEFYAAGRLARDAGGKQIKFQGVGEIVEFMRQTNEPKVFVLVPLEHEHQLFENDAITARKINDNQVFALVAVTKK